MLNALGQSLMLLRARWRWVRGCCPHCNRYLYAPFLYYMADYPNCPVCKDETENDLCLWHKYRTLGTTKREQTKRPRQQDETEPRAAFAAGADRLAFPVPSCMMQTTAEPR